MWEGSEESDVDGFTALRESLQAINTFYIAKPAVCIVFPSPFSPL